MFYIFIIAQQYSMSEAFFTWALSSGICDTCCTDRHVQSRSRYHHGDGLEDSADEL